jgi:hypothetical protein
MTKRDRGGSLKSKLLHISAPCWTYNPFFHKSLKLAPRSETCRNFNNFYELYTLLSAFVGGCIDYLYPRTRHDGVWWMGDRVPLIL